MASLVRNWALQSQLLVAIHNDDVLQAHQLFQAGVDTDTMFCINSRKRPALCLCVENNAADMVQLLLKLGVSINQGDSAGVTPLHVACTHGYPDLVGLLLKARANVNARSHQDRTPLHLAALSGNPAVIEMLLSHGANVNAVDKDGRTPLHYGAASLGSESAELLSASQACSTKVDVYGNTPLHYAVNDSGVSASTVRKLCMAGPAAVSVANSFMDTPLHIAVRSCRCDSEDVLRALIEVSTRAALNTRGYLGHTPLHIAVLENSLHMLRLLLTAGADTNTEDFLGHTPLVSAVRSRSVDAVALLVAAGARTKRLIQGGVIDSSVRTVDIRTLLEEATRQPQRLSGLCRKAITAHLGPAALPTLEKAALPSVWQQFLTFQSLNL